MLLAALAPLIWWAPGGQPLPPAAVTVQLLAINDLHGNLEPRSGPSSSIEGVPAGGAEYLATHLARAAAENPNTLIVGAGDLIGASPLLSALFHDEPTVAAVNAMHLAISSVGNHEFDKGWRELVRMQTGGCHPVDGCRGTDTYGGARYTYLSANVVHRGEDGRATTLFPPTAVRTIGGVKVGFIGETLRSTSQMVSAAGVRDLSFLDEASTANRYASELKRAGVNAIVLLIHQGGYQAREDAGDPNACTDFHGGIVPTLRRLSPDVKVVVSGHSHQAYVCTIQGRTVTSAASFGRVMTRLNLTIDRATDTIRQVAARNEVVTRDVPKDEEQSRIIARYLPMVKPLEDRVVGSISEDLTRAANDAGESSLGDIIADAQLAATAPPANGGAVVAFMNPGGIRVDLPLDDVSASGRARGEVTYGRLFAVQPFSNALTVVTLTGDAIRRVLEQQFHASGSATILQVSKGFTYAYRRTADPGRHVDPASIRINGTRVLPGTRVRVAASDFLIDGGDGFTVLSEGTNRTTAGPDLDAFEAYFKLHSPVAPGPQDRIVLIK